MLWCASVKICMRLELKQEIQEIDDEENDRCSSAEFQDLLVRQVQVTERSMKSGLTTKA